MMKRLLTLALAPAARFSAAPSFTFDATDPGDSVVCRRTVDESCSGIYEEGRYILPLPPGRSQA